MFPNLEATSSSYSCCTGVYCVDVGHALIYPQAGEKEQPWKWSSRYDEFDPLRVDETMLRGMASISSVTCIHNQSATVTTNAVVDAPDLLNVALILENEINSRNSASTKLLRLDLSKSPQFRPIVRLQAFGANRNILLVLVDSNGCIVSIQFDFDTWTPSSSDQNNSPINVISVPSLLAHASSSNDAHITTFGLTQERVLCLDKNRILLATNPFLLSVDLGETRGGPRVLPWSFQYASTNTSAPSFTTVFSSILGATSYNKYPSFAFKDVDMNPILSMCAADNDNTKIFTFHSDTILRSWHCPAGALIPDRVHNVNLSDLPSHTDWTDEPIRITAHAYDGNAAAESSYPANYYAAIFFETTLPFSDDTLGTPTTALKNQGITSRFIVVADSDRGRVISHALDLPKGPSSLVGASFVGNSPSLTAVIANHEGATALLVYSPPMDSSSIVQVVPEIVPRSGMLDDLAEQELWCLEYLPSPSTSTSLTTLSLHDLDVRFLQLLFRPMTCRGVGHVLPPSATRIRMALQKIAPGYCKTTTTTATTQQSIAVEVLTTLHAWRRSNRKELKEISSSSRPRITVHGPSQIPKGNYTARSFYESLQPQREPESLPHTDDELPVPQTPEVRISTSGQGKYDSAELTPDDFEEYKQLWQNFLIQIWQEEAIDRVCLAFSAEKGLVLRSGSISILVPNPPGSTVGSILDRVALRLVERMEKDVDTSYQLYLQEQRIMQALSNCIIDITSTADAVAAELISLSEDRLQLVVSEAELRHLEQTLHNNADRWVHQLQQIPLELIGLGHATASNANNRKTGTEATARTVQDRLATTSLCVRHLIDARQLFLGRYLVLRGIRALESIVSVAWVGYLRAASLLVASAQHVPCLKGSALTATVGMSLSPDNASPPKKRPSFDSSSSDSLLVSAGVTESTTALDVFLTSVFQKLQQHDGEKDTSLRYLPAATRFMSRLIRLALFRMFDSSLPTAQVGIKFPELQFIVSTSSRGVILEQPKLALTLLSPGVVATATREDDIQDRLESIAECLLILSPNYPQATAEMIIHRAFQLLNFDPRNLSESIRRINKISQHAVGTTKLVTEIHYAIETILREHSADLLVASSEYAKLVSLLFYKSLEAHRWETALFACGNNPNREQRLDHLQRLVTAMVDSGALSDLLVLCSLGEDVEFSEYARGLDLYGTAVETLGKAGYRDWYTHRASGSEALSDYQGALYALHASRNEWRRAAQALDLRYVNAIDALLLDSSKLPAASGFSIDTITSDCRTRLILDDSVLAATGAYNALCLVENLESKFIISGDFGKFPTLPTTKYDDQEIVGIKRARNRNPGGEQNVPSKSPDEYRLARYKDPQDLLTRAITAMGVRRIWVSGVIDKSSAEILLLEKDDPGRTIQVLIRELFKAAHYDLGLMLTLQAEESMPGRAEGLGIFQETMGYLLCDHLVALVIGMDAGSKPSLAQIVAALDSMCNSASPSVLLYRSPRKNEAPGQSAIRFASMALLERLTTKFTTAEVPLAAEVAYCFVEAHKAAELPQWLVSLLIYGSDPGISAPGLFAKRSSKRSPTYLGDPSYLLSIYMMNGNYHSACELVCAVLDPKGRSPATTVMRLPEKGDIDFVPYDKIDRLYNLVDAAIQNGDLSGEYKTVVLLIRSKMVKALEKHMDGLSISESGLRSARVLASR